MSPQEQVPIASPQERRMIGAVNPYALVESILKRRIDWSDPSSTKLMSEVLQTDYHELFDPKFNSPLYPGLNLNKATGVLEPLQFSEVNIMGPTDQLCPNLAQVKKLGDLKNVGVEDIANVEVSDAVLINGKLKLTVKAPSLDHTMTNTSMPKEVAGLILKGSQSDDAAGDWTPSGCQWKDIGDFFKDVTEYDDPIQGSAANCWLIAALAAVAWARPYTIAQRTRPTGLGETDRINAITFYSKGGGHDAPTATVEVTDKTIVYDWADVAAYCRSNDPNEIWPALYEKAFAKWCTQSNSDCPNILQTEYGDSGRACAQLTDMTPYYYDTYSRSADELWGIVRENSVAFKTFNPMTANTYGSGDIYSGSNIVANHAYTVLGWTMQNGKKYIVLRNPWGQTEPAGLGNTYDGILTVLDNSFWRPIDLTSNDGVFALEISAFKKYYAELCVAK